MTGISITVELDDAAARQALRDLVERVSDRRPFFKNVGEILQLATKDRFLSKTGPDGVAWAPLRPSTIKSKIRKGRSPTDVLKLDGHLAGSIRTIATNDEVQVGSPVDYAAIHQLGGTIDRAARQGKIWRVMERDGSVGRRFAKRKLKRKVETEVAIPAYRITIPARPYLGASDANLEDIAAEAITWLSER